VSLEFFIDIKSFRSYYGPGVDSASNRKGGRWVRLITLPQSVPLKSGNFNFLESSGPLQACNGIDLTFCDSLKGNNNILKEGK